MKARKFRAKAVLFDLWGTLGFSRDKKRFLHYVKLLAGFPVEEHGGKFSEIYENEMHRKKHPDPESELRALFRGLKYSPSKSEFRKALYLYGKMRADIALYPETKRVLAELKSRGFALCLVSNTSSFQSSAPKRLGISKFLDASIVSAEVGAIKPAKKIFLAALRELKLEPADCIMVGDKPRTDIDGATKSGMRAILIDRIGRHSSAEGAIAKISSLEELLSLLESEEKK